MHVKHLDDRTLPVQLTEVVYPGYERRIPGEVGAGCRCHAVLETSPLPALTPACFERHRMGLCNECDLSPCMGGFRLQTNHAGQLKLLQVAHCGTGSHPTLIPLWPSCIKYI